MLLFLGRKFKIQLYNVLSCKGFEVADKVGLSFGSCAKARLLIVLLFFINAFVRKWGAEELDIEYNFWLGFGGSFLGYLITISLTGNFGLSFIIGLVAMLVLGYGSGYLFGGGDSGGFG